MTLVDRLNALMEEHGVKNRAELAKGAGLPYTTIVAIFESGGDNTKLSTLRKIVDFFGVTLDDLVYDPSRLQSEPETIAAHHDGEDWTEEELEDIEDFKEILRLRRLKRQSEE